MHLDVVGRSVKFPLSPCSTHPAKNHWMRRSRVASPIICNISYLIYNILHIIHRKSYMTYNIQNLAWWLFCLNLIDRCKMDIAVYIYTYIYTRVMAGPPGP